MPSLLIMQWLIVGFFVLIHFLLGMIRGTAKSAWYLLAYAVTATLTFVLIANFTLTWFFTTQESMVGIIQWANGQAGGVLNDYMDYVTDPAITPVIFMILDLVIKIVLYSILFPIVRWLLTLIIFRPVWKHVFLKKMLAKQNDEREMAHESSGSDKKFKKRKKLKVNFLGRLGGGFVGAVRGVLVAFVFLLPILVFGSFIGKIDTAALTGGVSSTGPVVLAAGDPNDPFGLAEYATYLEQLDEMNAQGFGQVTDLITVNGVSFDRYVFDAMFTPIINDPNIENAKVNFIQELENVMDVAAIIVNNGYMDRDFSDLSNITDDDIANAQLIIQTIGRSDLLSYILSSGLDKAPDLIPTLVTTGPLADIDWESESLQDTLTYLVETDWHEEFNRIAAIVGALNDFMSPSDIVDLMDDPGSLASLEPAEITALTDVIRAIGDLHLLAGLNIGIEYAINLPDVQSNIAWTTDPDVYLKDKLAFILDNPDFFIGEGGEIDKVANLIESILNDDTADLEAILNSGGDFGVIMSSQSEALVTSIFSQLADMDILVNGLPIGVDFALYSLGGDAIADDLAGSLATALSDVDWSAEITNIGDIYAEAISLSLETIFAEDPDMLAFVDQTLQNANNMDSVRAIVSSIFEDSELVGNALNTAAPFIIDTMITDEGLKDIVQGVVLDANDDFDFNIGQEINSVLTIAEEISTFTTFSEIGSFGELSLDDKLALVADFGAMPQINYDSFKTALTGLQIFSKIDETLATDIAGYLDLTDTLYIPTDMLFSDDIGAMIDLSRDVAHYFYTESVGYSNYEDIDVTDLLDTLKTDLLDSQERSDLIFYNLIFQAQKLADEGSLSEFLTIPQSLLDADVESAVWDTEVNNLLGAIFDIATSIGEVDGITLSVKDIQSYMDVASGLPIDVITQYADLPTATAAFSGLDNSLILRASIPALLDGQGESLADTLFGHQLVTPTHLIDSEGLLNAGVFTGLINGFAVLLEDMNNTLGFTTIGELRGNEISVFLDAFNQTDDASIQAFIGSDLIHGIISDMITDPLFQEGLADTINGGQDTLNITADLFAVDPVLLDPSFTTKDVLLADEAANFLLMIKALQISDLDFATLGLETFTGLLDRHVDSGTGEDDFDRFFSSGYIYSVIDGILQLDSISSFVSDTLGDSLGVDMSGFDLTLPNEMLGQQSEADLDLIEAIEVGRIPRDEFRRVFTSIGLVDLDTIGISTFTSMVDPVASPDDFTTFIDSDFIYFVLAQLFDNDGFSDYIGTQLGDSFGDSLTLDMTVPSDAKGTQAEADLDTITDLEVDRMKRSELRNIMVSFSMLDIEAGVDVGAMLALFNSHAYIADDPLDDRSNDVYQFVDSIYLQDIFSQILLSDAIIDTIAATDSATPIFDAVDFSMPTPGLLGTQPDGYDRMTKDEVYYILNGLNALGVSDFDNVDLGLDTIQAIDDQTLLKSNYLYAVLDLAISNQDSLTIPIDALETSGVYNGMITKDEIHNLFTAFNTLPDGVSPTSLSVESITSADILAIINTESLIINQVISDEVETALASVVTIDNVILPEAYEVTVGVDRLLIDELRAMVTSMDVIGLTDLSGSFDIDNVGVTELQDLHDLGLGEGTVSGADFDAYVIHYLITDQIETALTIDQLTLPEAYNNDSGNERLNADEIQALIETMDEIGISDLSGAISVDDIGQAELQKIHYFGLGTDPVEDEYESYIIHKLISEQVETALSVSQPTLPEAYETNATTGNDWMNADEIQALIESMSIIGLTDFSSAVSVSAVGQAELQDLHYLGLGTGLVSGVDYESYIIHKLISEQVESALSVDVLSLPEAYETNATTGNDWMNADEIQALIESMSIIGLTDFSSAVSVSAVGQAELQDLHYLGLGTGLVSGVDYESYIIHKLISEQVESALSVDVLSLPEAYETNATTGNDWMNADEIQALIESMSIIGLTDFSSAVSVSAVGQAELQDLHYLGLGTGLVSGVDYESYIIHKLISEQVESALSVDVLSLPEAYETNATTGNDWMRPNEIQALIESMSIIGLTDFSSAVSVSAVGQAELQDLHYLGLGTGLVSGVDYESYIIHQLISEQVETALSVSQPTLPESYTLNAATSNYWMNADEIQALIESMSIIGLTDFSSAVSVSAVGQAELQDLHYLGLGTGLVSGVDYESYIIHKLITEQIETALTVSEVTHPESYTNVTGNDWMRANEVQALIDSMTVIGLTDFSSAISVSNLDSTDLQDLHYLGLGTDPVDEKYDSYIIHTLISDQVESAFSVSFVSLPEAYDAGGQNRMLADEIQALILSMNEMGLTDLSAVVSPDALTNTQLQNIHYLGLGTDPGTDTYDSYIVHRMLSDGVKSALTNRPTTIYMGNGDITADEIQGVVSAIGILNPGGSLNTMSFANGGLTPTKISNLLDLDARIVDRQISDGIMTANLDVPEAYATIGDANYDASYVTGDLTISEMYALVEAMTIMGISDLTGVFNPNSITVTNLQSLHYVGLGINPGIDTYQSYMVHHMISDGIKGTLANRPSTIYMGNGDITASEVQGVISAVGILNTDPSATLGTMSFANNGLTAAKITALLDLDTRIIDRQISEGIISANLDVPEAYAILGEPNYDASYVTGDLNIDEMYAIAASMDVMGLSDLSSGFSATNLTTTQLQNLHYLGQGVDPVDETYDSYMIHSIISDSLTGVNPQTIAYDADGYIKAIEIQGFIDDLNTLGIVSINSFAAISDSSGVLSAFSDDTEVTAVFANSSTHNLTLMYYFIDGIMDPSDNTIPGATRTTDAYGFIAVIRDELRDFIINNN